MANVEEISEYRAAAAPSLPKARILQTLFLVLVCAGIILCQWLLVYRDPAAGIGLGLGLVLAVYVLLSVLRLDWRISRSAESLALVPLFIIFTSSLPWFFVRQQYLIPAVYACLLALCLWHIYRNNISLRNILNFDRKTLKYVLIALAAGIPIGILEYYILRPAPAMPSFAFQYFLRDAVYMLLFVSLAEELLFRGLIQQDLTSLYGWKAGLVWASVMFAAMHMTWRSAPEMLFVFGAALVMGGLYIRSKSLAPPVVLHAVNNVVLVSVLPYIWRLS